MKREAKELLSRSLDSMLIAVDHFNSSNDRGRHDAVLIFLDRAFELLLKACIVHNNGLIREKKSSYTISLDKCLRKWITDADVQCLNEEEALTIQNINLLRDAAQHYFIKILENQAYLHTQAGFTLYKSILKKIFDKDISEYFSSRVLPITTTPPEDFIDLVNTEFREIRRLLAPGGRRELGPVSV